MDDIEQPVWEPRYETRDEAIAAAVLASEPGDRVWIHQPSCVSWDGTIACSCEPDVIVVVEHRA